jgi:nitrogen regulatory protein PII-like uncharacterized protein
MIEKLIEAIGRFLSALFRKSGDIIDDTRVEMNMLKEQAKVAKVNTQSTLTVSVTGESHVNYFRNRVVGEFLRVMASLVPYQFEQSSGRYVAYFVRHKRRSFVEYIKFSKNHLEDSESEISYTYLNKIISSTGITTNIGRTDKKILVVDDNISNCIYDSISGQKAPLYLVHILDNRVGVGNPTFVYECWIITVKLISKKVDNYLRNDDTCDGKMIEILMNQAGIHMYMSYFRSISNPYYRTYYKKGAINSIVEAIKDYNSRHFNVNKILNFSFEPAIKGKGSIEFNKEKNQSTLSLYGVSIKFTGNISEKLSNNAISRFNYKFAEILVKSEDDALRRNFLFYLFSTGGLDDSDIVQLKEEEEVEGSKFSDTKVSEFNNKVEPVVTKVMQESNFRETESGDLASMDFEQFINSEITVKSSTTSFTNPTVVAPAMLSDDIRAGGTIEELRKQSENTSNTGSSVEESDESSSKDSDFVRRLQTEATGQATVSRPEDSITQLESASVDESKSIKELLNTPLIQWSSEDCLKVLGSEETLNANITRQDVLDRMMFLSSHSKN